MIYPPAEDSYLLTEILKEKLPLMLKENSNLKFLEIGAGSGIHLETVSKVGVKKENIFSVDINQNAVNHCKSLGFNCMNSDLFGNVWMLCDFYQGVEKKSPLSVSRKEHEENKGCPRFDVIIFNPPYLPEDKFDKEKDTTGGKKGCEIINRFLNQAKDYLKNNGMIFLITSSLTKDVDFLDYEKKQIGCEKLFMEELCVWEVKFKV